MGKSRSDLKGNRTGPGDYEIKGEIELKKSGYQFSRSRRDNNGEGKVPGPGTYEY